jgi:hypothetical protein
MISSVLSVVRGHPIVTFFVLTYAIGWGLIPFWTFQASSPFIAALIVIPLTQGVAGLKQLGLRMIRWRVRWYWYAVAIGIPLAVLGLIVGLNVALGASAPSLVQFSSVSTILLVFGTKLINPGDGPLGEEPGWRAKDSPTHAPARKMRGVDDDGAATEYKGPLPSTTLGRDDSVHRRGRVGGDRERCSYGGLLDHGMAYRPP